MKNSSLVKMIQNHPVISPTGELGGRMDVIRVIGKLCSGGNGAEIGTFNGTFADMILRQTEISHLYCVDPYVSYDEFRDAINTMDLDLIFKQAQNFLSPFAGRVSFVREFSLDAAAGMPDGGLSFVYIDGNHQSEFVEKDMHAWWPKLKEGGFLMGDDAADLSDENRNSKGDVRIVHTRAEDGTELLYGEYGVYHALRRFTEEMGLEYILTGSQYIIPKPY